MRVIIFSLLASLALANVAPAAPLSSVAAVVNGEMISSRELDKSVMTELAMNRIDPVNPANAERIREIKKQALDRLISEKVLMQEAARLELIASDDMVEEELNRIVKDSGVSPEQFAAEASKQGLSVEGLRDRLRVNITTQRLIGRMVYSKIVITEEEIKQYFEESGGTVPAPPPPPAPEPLSQEPRYEIKITHVRFGMIIYPNSANAEQWAENIASGKNNFESVARRLSVGPNPEGGGDLGMIRVGDLAPGLLDIAYMLKDKGAVTPVLDLGSAKAQIKLIDLRTTKKELPAPAPPPVPVVIQEDYKSDVLDAATAGKIEEFLRRPMLESRFEAYTQQLRDKAIIDIKL